MGSLLLYKGITLAIFSSSGKTPSSIDKLIIFTRGNDIYGTIGLTVFAAMASHPGLLSLKLFIILQIFSSLVGVRYIDFSDLAMYLVTLVFIEGIILLSVGPTFIKKSLNLSLMSTGLCMIFSPHLNVSCCFMTWSLFIMIFNMRQVFLRLFLCKLSKSWKCFFSAKVSNWFNWFLYCL